MAFPINPSPGDTYTDDYGTVWVYAGSLNGWYRQTVIPGNDTTYTTGGGGSTAAGAAGEIQYTDGTNLAASADLSWDDTAKLLDVGGDITLDDGGTYTTTVQTITPTANRTISFPDATGTVALVAGSSGQVAYNNAGSNAGLTSASIGSTGEINISLAGAASTPPVSFTGSWFTGGTGTTTKPQLLIEPTGTTSTAWSTNGTGLGVNAPSGFVGRLLDLQVNGTSRLNLAFSGTSPNLIVDADGAASPTIYLRNGSSPSIIKCNSNGFDFLNASNVFLAHLSTAGYFVNKTYALGFAGSTGGVGTPDALFFRDDAGIIAQRNSTNAQTFRVYNTYTDASNYERGFLQWNSGVFEIGTEGAGTGSEQPVRITAATLNIPNLPTYADDAAAGTGGLVAGDVYKTSTGELRIKL